MKLGLRVRLLVLCVSAVLFGLFSLLAGCGGGGGGGGDGGSAATSTKTTMSGTVSAPSGTSAESLTVVTLGVSTPVSSQGGFSTQVYQDGVAVVAAMPAGKNFGLMNVVAANSTQPTGAVVTAAAITGATSTSSVNLDAKTTAVSLVFISPFFITNDPAAASALLPVIEKDPKVAILATVINNVFASSDAMNNPAFKQALIDAVQSVINTLSAQQKTVAAAVQNTSSSVNILQIPKNSAMGTMLGALSLSSTSYYADQDYTIVTADSSGTGYGINVTTKNGGSVDWNAEVMKLDAGQFTSFADFQTKALNKRTIYNNEKANIIGRMNATAKSFFRYGDFISSAYDHAFEDSFGAKPLKLVPISATEDAIYLVRSYSGAPGVVLDTNEEGFVLTQVPNGPLMFTSSLATNVVMVALDTASIFVEIKNLSVDAAVKAGLKAFQDQVSLVSNPTMNDMMGITAAVLKAIVEEGTIGLVKNTTTSVFKDAAKILLEAIDVPGKLSSIGKIADRMLQMLVSATPMETTLIVVGNPLPSAATYYAISGRVTSNNAGLAGVTVSLSGTPSKSALTNANGEYVLTNSANGTYSITPAKTGYTFNPASQSVIVNGANVINQNFTASVPTVYYSMSGTIRIGSNSGAVLSGATVTIAGKTATTSSNGTYSITGIPAGTYVLTVSKSGYDTYTNPAYYVGSNQTGINNYLSIIVILAKYALNNTSVDSTGNNGNITLTNALYQGDGSVFSNGKYPNDDATGSIIQSPIINNFYFNDFSVSVDFKITSVPTSRRNPVIVGGNSCRWIGINVETDGTISMLYNNYNITNSSLHVPLNSYNTALIQYNGSVANLYLNGVLACSQNFLLNNCGDFNFQNTNYSNGSTFLGYLKNLTVFSTTAGTDYTLSGTIRIGSNTGTVLSGAIVSIAGKTATTSSTGTYTITGIPAGTYAFSVSKTGYDTYTNPAYYIGSNLSGRSNYLTATTVTPASRFIDKGNGTIYDTVSNLTWLKNANCFGSQTWNDAIAYSYYMTSGQCGLSDGSKAGDWRLPSIDELLAFTDAGYFSDSLNAAGFTNVQAKVYWSSTPWANVTGYAWAVSMAVGANFVSNYDLTFIDQCVWPVRSGQ